VATKALEMSLSASYIQFFEGMCTDKALDFETKVLVDELVEIQGGGPRFLAERSSLAGS
jgi:hypothetical protein